MEGQEDVADPMGNQAPNHGKPHLTETQKIQIISHRASDKSFREIGRILGICHTTCSKFHSRWLREGSLTWPSNTGKKRKTSPQDDRFIVTSVKRNRFISAVEIKKSTALPSLSENTIRARIKESGEFNSYWAVNKPFINEPNRRKRVQWCKAHLDWTPAQWRRVLWSDESPFVLRYKGRVRVWRMANERYEKNCIRGTVKHDTKIMVWGAFSAGGVGDLMLIEGTMVKETYLNILEDHMLPSADLLFGRENWTFQQDNDPKHTAIVVREWFQEYEVPLLPWPAQSPDLNPIENLWSILDQRTKSRQANSKQELFDCLKSEWERLPVDLLTRLVDSMPERCRAVIANKGYPTKY